MTSVQQTPPEKQHIYLEKVNQFFGQVKKWLPPHFETVQIENRLLEDKTGEYKTPSLSIIKKGGPTTEGIVANLIPEGISFLTNDDLIEIKGAWDDEEIAYIQEKNLIRTVRAGKECPMDEGFETEGWYWIIKTENRVRPMSKEVFFEIIKRVSDQPMDIL